MKNSNDESSNAERHCEKPAVEQATEKPGHVNRRSFLGGVTAATVAAGFLGLPTIADAKEIGPENPVQRREDEWVRRNGDAVAEKLLPPKHPTNGDEERYFNKIGNYSKGLPHDALGDVELSAYTGMITALTSGLASDFEAIQLGGVVKLSNPQSVVCLLPRRFRFTRRRHRASAYVCRQRARQRNGGELLDGFGARCGLRELRYRLRPLRLRFPT